MASRSATELAGKLHRYAQLVPDANRDTVGNVALMAKGHFETGIASAGGKPGSEIQGAKGGRRLGASYDIKGGRNPTALIRYRGPVHLLFGNTAPHMIIASRLGFRSTASRLTSRIGANAAFGGSNLGVFAGGIAATTRSDAGRAARGRNVKARKRALTTPRGPRAYAFHPGTTGRNTWPATRRSVVAGAPRVFAASHRSAILRAGLGR